VVYENLVCNVWLNYIKYIKGRCRRWTTIDARWHGDSSAKQCHRNDIENVWIQYMNWWEVCQIIEVLCVYLVNWMALFVKLTLNLILY